MQLGLKHRNLQIKASPKKTKMWNISGFRSHPLHRSSRINAGKKAEFVNNNKRDLNANVKICIDFRKKTSHQHVTYETYKYLLWNTV